MRVRKYLTRQPRFTMPKPVSRPGPGEEQPRKNGPLTLAVLASVLVMVVLGLLNIRLIRDPTTAGKAFGPLVSSRSDQDRASREGPECSGSGEEERYTPPEVTFYRKLVAQEEPKATSEKAFCEPAREGSRDAEAEKKPRTTSSSQREDKDSKETGSSKGKPSPSAVQHVELPKAGSGEKTFMVQVGAFSHPRIAQQWAARWKSRGYDVTLKPVARPKTGVIYRLYLGKFSSQEEADALVERLKAKEGISAFRLLVRN